MVKKIKKNKLLEDLKSRLIDLLKGKFIALVLKAIFKTTIGGGIKVIIVKFLAKFLFKEVAKPLIEESFKLMGYFYEEINGEITVKKFEEAKKNGDEQSYDNIISNL